MRYLIYGAGTIGLTYAYLLTAHHDVDVLALPERYEEVSQGVPLAIKDLRQRNDTYQSTVFHPQCITSPEGYYDVILVTVNRCQLQSVLPMLAKYQPKARWIGFMQNNWHLAGEVDQYISPDDYFIAFPSSVGGGRDDHGIKVIVFPTPTRVGGIKAGVKLFMQHLKEAGVATSYDAHLLDWMKVHYLQQSATAGAIASSGSFSALTHDPGAIRRLIMALRDGMSLCRHQGVAVWRVFPLNVLSIMPLRVATPIMQHALQQPDVVDMVTGHMKHGFGEWLAGYDEVLAEGRRLGIPMTAWQLYNSAVQRYKSTALAEKQIAAG